MDWAQTELTRFCYLLWVDAPGLYWSEADRLLFKAAAVVRRSRCNRMEPAAAQRLVDGGARGALCAGCAGSAPPKRSAQD